jgi:hypothetical protein
LCNYFFAFKFFNVQNADNPSQNAMPHPIEIHALGTVDGTNPLLQFCKATLSYGRHIFLPLQAV